MVRTKKPIQTTTSSVTESESKPDDRTKTEPLVGTNAETDTPATKAIHNNNGGQVNDDNSPTKFPLDASVKKTSQDDLANKENMTQQLFTPYPINPPPFGLTQEAINYKVSKIQSMFSELTLVEIHKMLDDCYYNEDELMLRLITQQDYLPQIRSLFENTTTTMALYPSSIVTNTITEATTPKQYDTPKQHQPVPQHENSQPQYQHYAHHPYQAPPPPPPLSTSSTVEASTTLPLPSPSSLAPSSFVLTPSYNEPATCHYRTLQPSTSPTPQPTKKGSNLGKKYKKRQPVDDYASMPTTPLPTSSVVPTDQDPGGKSRVRSVGRLALDDALQQIKDNPKEQSQAYEGWSAARIRAYGLIDKNPNTYYYRFNAPGEEQHKGAWTAEEKQLFLKRLAEVGANSQWGIFSMALPGRVGYQCSNFYRLLIETGEISDSNYVVDEKGKAHYLFEKKTETGEIQKAVRTHYKHKPKQSCTDNHMDDNNKKTKRKKKRRLQSDEDDNDDGEYTGKPVRSKSKRSSGSRRHYTRQSRST